MFSFFSPFPFLRILGLWIIGFLIGPYGLLAFALSLMLIFRQWRIVGLIFIMGLSYVRFAQIANEWTIVPSHDAFVFQVDQDPVEGAKSLKIRAKVIAVRQKNRWIQVHAVAILYVPLKGISPRSGQVYQVYGSLKPIRDALLPGAFDWKSYYARQGIYASIFVASKSMSLLRDAKTQPHFIDKLRNQAVFYLHQALPIGVHRNVAEAMFLGIGGTIDFETRQSYAALGAIHILSVSGMHVGLLYMGLQFLFGFLKRFRTVGLQVYFALIMLVLWTYAAMSGFSAPVLRSAWMFSVLLFAQVFRLRSHPLNIWAFSCFVLLVIQPNELFQVGFQLSYAAVLGLILFQNKLVQLWKPKTWIAQQTWELTCVAISAQIFTWPLIIFYFHQFPNPFYFFLLNPALVLLSTCTLGIGFLYLILAPIISYMPIVFSAFGHLFLFSFELLHGLMFYTTGRFQTVISFVRMNGFELGAYYLGIALVWYWRAMRRVWGLYLGIGLLSFIMIYRLMEPWQDEAYLTVAEKQLVFLRTKGIYGQSYGAVSEAWLQANASPWWARNQGVDTSTHKWPQGSFQWIYQGNEFVYLTKPSVQRNPHNSHLILAADLDLRDPRFLTTWRRSTWYFIRKPSAYRLSKLKTFWPKKVYYLAEQAAVHLP
ncbi:ComEC/Rec2 family competence protein [Aquirufa echingensis]|uniref:ComEC/Rec2 family competence protein n=1 Tax=Aquirufa echingensis TaxID=3096516 RepID=A0ABW6CYM9_9BACT